MATLCSGMRLESYDYDMRPCSMTHVPVQGITISLKPLNLA